MIFFDIKDIKFFKIKELEVKNIYFMSLNFLFGGMKLMLCLVLNLLSLIYW